MTREIRAPGRAPLLQSPHSLPLWGAALLSLCLSAACGEEKQAPQVQLSLEVPSETIDFGAIVIGGSQSRDVLLKNTGNAALDLTVTPSEMFPEAFNYQLVDSSIAPGKSALLTLSFKANNSGELTAELTIAATGPGGEQVMIDTPIKLKGAGLSQGLDIDMGRIVFAKTVTNSTRAASLKLENTGDTKLTVDTPENTNLELCPVSGLPSSAFCLKIEKDSFELEKGMSRDIKIVFAPKVAGMEESSQLRISYCNSSDCRQEIDLQGVAVGSGLSCDTTALSFGEVTPGNCGTAKFTCKNEANLKVKIIDFSILAGSSPAFSSATTERPTLLEGESIEAEFEYCPTAIGSDNGTVQVFAQEGGEATNPISVTLMGAGGGPELQAPSRLSLDQTTLIVANRQSIKLRNTGTSNLVVMSAQMATDADHFKVGTPLPLTIEAGQESTLELEFQPLEEKTIRTALQLLTNDADSPVTNITVIGQGVNLPSCQFTLTPQAGNPLVIEETRPDNTRQGSIWLENRGSADCVIGSIQLEAENNAPFTLVSDRAKVLRPGARDRLIVNFSPTVAGGYQGMVKFYISSSQSPQQSIRIQATSR